MSKDQELADRLGPIQSAQPHAGVPPHKASKCNSTEPSYGQGLVLVAGSAVAVLRWK